MLQTIYLSPFSSDGELVPGGQPIRLTDSSATSPTQTNTTSPAVDEMAPPVFVHPLRDVKVVEGERVRLDATVIGKHLISRISLILLVHVMMAFLTLEMNKDHLCPNLKCYDDKR